MLKLLTQHPRSALAVGAHGGACAPEIRLRCDCAVQVGTVFCKRACVRRRGRQAGWCCGWRWIRRGAVPAFDRWHVGLSKLHRRLAISLLHGVAGLTAGVANRPLENDRQTRRSPRPARHEKHKRTKADRRWRDSLSKDAMRVATPGCRWCGSGGIIATGGTHRILIFVRRVLSSGSRESLSMCRVVNAASDHSDSPHKTAFRHCGSAPQRPISRPRALDGTALPIDLRGVKCRRT